MLGNARAKSGSCDPAQDVPKSCPSAIHRHCKVAGDPGAGEDGADVHPTSTAGTAPGPGGLGRRNESQDGRQLLGRSARQRGGARSAASAAEPSSRAAPRTAGQGAARGIAEPVARPLRGPRRGHAHEGREGRGRGARPGVVRRAGDPSGGPPRGRPHQPGPVRCPPAEPTRTEVTVTRANQGSRTARPSRAGSAGRVQVRGEEAAEDRVGDGAARPSGRPPRRPPASTAPRGGPAGKPHEQRGKGEDGAERPAPGSTAPRQRCGVRCRAARVRRDPDETAQGAGAQEPVVIAERRGGPRTAAGKPMTVRAAPPPRPRASGVIPEGDGQDGQDGQDGHGGWPDGHPPIVAEQRTGAAAAAPGFPVVAAGVRPRCGRAAG